MSGTPNDPEPIEAKVRELEKSRRRHFWVLLLLVFSTCGYMEGRDADVGQRDDVARLSNEVRRLRQDVRTLSTNVERLSGEVERTKAELQRASRQGDSH
jgi:uncharacterized protein YlxW (UPF0749 family)